MTDQQTPIALVGQMGPTADVVYAMMADGEWWLFNEYNIDICLQLLSAGLVEKDPVYNNRHDGMVTSMRIRRVLNTAPALHIIDTY